MKTIKICCVGSSLISIDELEPFQGELKELTDIAYMQCKNSILKLGFSEPITVWKSPIGITYVLGGHQRLKTLLRMRAIDGYLIPLIPINEVQCESTKEAKEKVLALTSQFGAMTKESLETFCLEDLNIDFEVVVSNYRFPELEMIIKEENITKKGNDLLGEDTSSETTTIRVTVAYDDREEAIQKITNALKGMNPDII